LSFKMLGKEIGGGGFSYLEFLRMSQIWFFSSNEKYMGCFV
jgi:hypothetical protein